MKVVSYYKIDGESITVSRYLDQGIRYEYIRYEYEYVPGMPLTYLSSTSWVEYQGKQTTDHVLSVLKNDTLQSKDFGGRCFYLWRFMPTEMYNELKGNIGVKKAATAKKERIVKDKASNLRKLLREHMNMDGGICKYGMEYLDPKGKRKQVLAPNIVCHAKINGDIYDNSVKGLVLDQLALELSHRVTLTKKEYTPWLSWYLKKSPFSKYLKPATPYTAMKYGVLIDTSKANAEVAAWVAVTSRWLFEHQERIPIFNKLRAIEGSSDNTAFVLANTVNLLDNGDYKLYCNTSAHDAFHSFVTMDELNDVFVQGKVNAGTSKVLNQATERGFRYIAACYATRNTSFYKEPDNSLYNFISKFEGVIEGKDRFSKFYIIPSKVVPALCKAIKEYVG